MENKERKKILTPNFEMHIVELEKYLKNVPKDKQDKLRSPKTILIIKIINRNCFTLTLII
mgnify:CR=1 FL=1